jgi:murein DD-endopeptidase MepM/ murein hydrolase activator NlpD
MDLILLPANKRVIPTDIKKPYTTPELVSLKFSPNYVEDIEVNLGDDGLYKANMIKHPLTRHLVRAEGKIESSLYKAAIDVGIPASILGALINVFAFDIDFQREIRKGDRFAAMFESLQNKDGRVVDHGEVLLAEMTVQGKLRRFYRFKDKNGFVDYYDEKGRSVRKALLRTPIDGARISSGFGKRRHPVLGYSKMHKGTDFAARRGTPIYAAGDGVIEFSGRNGSFGNYVRIRHNDTYKTAYAHMSRIDKRARKGKRIRQRQIIGYVGTTGRSTGPHLHFEVLKKNRQVNPLSVKLPTGKTLAGKDLKRFKTARSHIENQYAEMKKQTKLAAN